MCVNFTVKWQEELRKNRAQYEGGVYWKGFMHSECGLHSPYRVGRAFKLGKVYFDKKGVISDFFNDVRDEKIQYERGFHAHRNSKTPTLRFYEYKYPVMLVDITAISVAEIAAKVMLPMTEEDYKRYNRDVNTPPIKIKEDVELEPNVV